MTVGLLALWFITLAGVALAGPSKKDEVVGKYLSACSGKPSKDASCDNLRKDFVEILKESLLTLGSSADRSNLQRIAGIFRSEEVELRIAVADAIGMIGPQDQDVDMLIPLTNDRSGTRCEIGRFEHARPRKGEGDFAAETTCGTSPFGANPGHARGRREVCHARRT